MGPSAEDVRFGGCRKMGFFGWVIFELEATIRKPNSNHKYHSSFANLVCQLTASKSRMLPDAQQRNLAIDTHRRLPAIALYILVKNSGATA